MTRNDYSPIITDSTKKTFFHYVDSLDIPQIDYFAIGVQNLTTKESISLMSRPEWQKHFAINQYAGDDPLRKIAIQTKRNLIPFSEIDYFDNYGAEIMRQRSKMGIKDGIVLMERYPKFNYMITLGTGYSKFDAFDFIKRYHDKLSTVKSELIQLIDIDAKAFLPKYLINPSIHLSTDAK